MAQHTKAVRIKLKADCLDKVRQWAQEINQRRDEALQSLQQEGITIEAAFLDTVQGEHYLVYVMKGDIEGSKKVAAASASPIDVLHKEFKTSCWQSVHELEPLIWLETKQ